MIHAVRCSLSVVSVEVRFVDADQAAEQFRRAWAGAVGPLVPPSDDARYEVRASSAGFEVTNLRTRTSRVLPNEVDVVPFVEAALYADVEAAHATAGLTALHAGAAEIRGTTFLFVGASGAGKSALVRAAVAAGGTYLGDEHVITDGRRLWGIPRAIHLDPVSVGDPPLPWHVGADLETYRFVDTRGRACALPLVTVPPAATCDSPRDVTEVRVVELARAEEDSVCRMDAVGALTALASATHRGGDPLALRAASAAPAWRLAWRDPDTALRSLLAAMHTAAS